MHSTDRTQASVRLAQASDLNSVQSCVSAAFEMYIERIGKPPGPMLLDYARLIDERSVWVAEIGTTIEGVLVQYETPDGFYIDTVASSPRTRGQGVGRALLQFAECEAVRRGHDAIYLCTNAMMTENQRFYPAIGYVEYDRKFDDGYDRVFHRKQLSTDHAAEPPAA